MDGVKKCKHGRNFCCECHMAHEALKPENQRIYPVGTTRDYESELAALREELEESYRLSGIKVSKLQQRLTAAEQRNAELQKAIFSALDDSSENAETGEITIMRTDYEALAILIGEPTESGASE